MKRKKKDIKANDLSVDSNYTPKQNQLNKIQSYSIL